MTSPAIQCSFICIATSVIKCLQRHIVRNILIRCENSNVFPFLFWQKNWWVQFLLLVITSKFFAILVDQGKKRRGSEGDTLHETDKEKPIQRPSISTLRWNTGYLFSFHFFWIWPTRTWETKKKISTRLTKENPMQSPSIPPMLAMNVVVDITWGGKTVQMKLFFLSL